MPLFRVMTVVRVKWVPNDLAMDKEVSEESNTPILAADVNKANPVDSIPIPRGHTLDANAIVGKKANDAVNDTNGWSSKRKFVGVKPIGFTITTTSMRTRAWGVQSVELDSFAPKEV
jgi:hypothetical protein